MSSDFKLATLIIPPCKGSGGQTLPLKTSWPVNLAWWSWNVQVWVPHKAVVFASLFPHTDVKKVFCFSFAFIENIIFIYHHRMFFFGHNTVGVCIEISSYNFEKIWLDFSFVSWTFRSLWLSTFKCLLAAVYLSHFLYGEISVRIFTSQYIVHCTFSVWTYPLDGICQGQNQKGWPYKVIVGE